MRFHSKPGTDPVGCAQNSIPADELTDLQAELNLCTPQPANHASGRAVLAPGYRPIGAEVLFPRQRLRVESIG